MNVSWNLIGNRQQPWENQIVKTGYPRAHK